MRHFKVDRSKIPQRDPRAEAESSREHGFYQYPVYEVVPISSIQPEKVWKAVKLEKNLKAMEAGRPLAPIDVTQKGRRYSINDGIHRYNASVQMGYTHIPIVKWVTLETPELLDRGDPEKPKLKPGAFVRLKDPSSVNAASPWAMVAEHLFSSNQKGVKRHKYSLIGFEKWEPEEADFLGDFFDEAFETNVNPPRKDAEALRAFGRLMRIARRVASSWLESDYT